MRTVEGEVRTSPSSLAGRWAGWQWRHRLLPYWLVLPAALLFAAVLGYPLFLLFELSFQEFGLRQLFTHTTEWVGLANYASVFEDRFFWVVVGRTVLFTVANVGLTLIVGMLVALLMRRLGRFMRVLVSVGMVLAWVMPSVASAVLWQWLFDTQYGIVNWLLTRAHLGSFTNFDWLGRNAILAFLVITLMIVWQAVPFVALSLYAAMTQIPNDLYEAVRVDGAGALAAYRSITLPMLRPIILLLAILSTIWDFNVFNQIWVMTQGGPNQGTIILGVWSFIQAFAGNQFGRGAAIAVVSVLLLCALSSYYVRQLVRAGELR